MRKYVFRVLSLDQEINQEGLIFAKEKKIVNSFYWKYQSNESVSVLYWE